MENFKLCWDYLGANCFGDDEVFHVQCDNMHCYTSITSNPTCLSKWIADLMKTKKPHLGNRVRVSMDMIWDQYFDDCNLKTPVTLQFCHESRCIIYHVYPPNNFPRSPLVQFLNDSCVDFVGFGLIEKVQYLRKAYNLEVMMKNWYDIPFMARLLDPKRCLHNFDLPLQNMVFKEFFKWYAKPADILQRNWRLFPLSPDKVMYATLDCYFAYQLAVRLNSSNDRIRGAQNFQGQLILPVGN